MTIKIDHIKAKLERAHDLIEGVQVELRDFYESNPYEVAIREDVQSGERVYFISRLADVPHRLTTTVADAIQNLRSPLDQLAYQLVLEARSGSEPNWPVYYPISKSAKDYVPNRNGRLKGVRQEVLKVMDATEPYKDGKGHILWQLNELNQADKHKLLIGAGTFTSGVDVSGDFTQMFQQLEMPPDLSYDPKRIQIPPLFLRETRTVPLRVGEDLYIEPLDKAPVPTRHFSFSVSLNAPSVIKSEAVIETLKKCASEVDRTVNLFEPFLG